MDKNLKLFGLKSVLLITFILGIIFAFRFPIDYFGLTLLSMNEATRIFSKSDALKIMALAVLFFALYYKDTLAKIAHKKHNIAHSVLYALLGVGIVGFYYFLRYLANVREIDSGIALYAVMGVSLASLFAAFCLFLAAFFSFDYLMSIYKKLKKPIWITSLLTVIGYFLLMGFQGLWPFFVYYITLILYRLFIPFFPVYMELGRTPILDVNGFTVSIGAPCSGIESMFLFAAFSIGIFIIDRKKIQKKAFVLWSIAGFIGIYFVNVLRLYLLILTGIYINPEFAVGLFHTNVGWILFVVYFIFYYWLMKKFIYRP